MIPAPDTLTQVDELPGDEYKFGIGDPRWVMRTQAELYSDVTTAIIREYSTNAYDANVMAGNPDPIEVTLPSLLNPYFTVEDKGVGMDLDVFANVYTQFGVSDKRESNDTNGMLGYGSKSGVAYTTSFNVTSVKDGNKINAVVMRKPDWEIVLKVVSAVKTDEPNGTKISIPVHNVDEFRHKANEFYKFWLPGRVLVNGKALDHAVGEKITDNLYYSREWNTSYVVMGNVAYRIANPEALFRDTRMNHINFVAYVDDFKTEDGSAPVEFTPSREDLKYSERTKQTLSSIIHAFEDEIVELAQAEIDNSADHATAFKNWSKWTNMLGRSLFADLEFKGDKLETTFTVKGKRYHTRQATYSVSTINSWAVENMEHTMFVTDFSPELASRHKAMAKEYANLNGWGRPNYIIFTPMTSDEIVSKWISKDRFVKWDDLKEALPKKAKQPRTIASGPRRLTGSFDFITRTGRKYEQPLPSSTKDVYWISLQNEKEWSVQSILSCLKSDATVIILPGNRIAKFNRENPSIGEFTKWAKAQVVLDGSSLLCDKGKAAMNYCGSTVRWATAFDLSKVDDPMIAEIAKNIKEADALTKKYKANHALASYCKMHYNGYKPYAGQTISPIDAKYPLLQHLSYYRVHKHTYIYMNAVHSAEKEKNNE